MFLVKIVYDSLGTAPFQSDDLFSFSPYILVAHTHLLIVLREVDNSFNHGSQNSTVFMHYFLFDKQR